MASTARAERQRSSTCTKRWAATSLVDRNLGVAASLLFFRRYMYFTAVVCPEATVEGRRAKVEFDSLFATVSPVPKHEQLFV